MVLQKKIKFSEKGSKNPKVSEGCSFVVTNHPSLNFLSPAIKGGLNI